MTTKAKPVKFTVEELKVIGDAAKSVWNEIGYDVLRAIGDENGKGEGATVSRRDVIEMVLDASRLEESLRGRNSGASPELVQRVTADIYGERSEVEAFLKRDVFTYGRYGF